MDTARRVAVVIPLDDSFPARAEAAGCLFNGLTSRARALTPNALTAQQRRRLGLVLRGLDGWLERCSYRQIAKVLFGPDSIPAGRGWKTHELRGRTIRLYRELMHGAYLNLLRHPASFAVDQALWGVSTSHSLQIAIPPRPRITPSWPAGAASVGRHARKRPDWALQRASGAPSDRCRLAVAYPPEPLAGWLAHDAISRAACRCSSPFSPWTGRQSVVSVPLLRPMDARQASHTKRTTADARCRSGRAVT
jgi:hypothetical protein